MDRFDVVEAWWNSLDRDARRRLDADLTLGLPDDLADGMEAAGIELRPGALTDRSGARRLRLPPLWLRLFIDSHGDEKARGTS